MGLQYNPNRKSYIPGLAIQQLCRALPCHALTISVSGQRKGGPAEKMSIGMDIGAPLSMSALLKLKELWESTITQEGSFIGIPQFMTAEEKEQGRWNYGRNWRGIVDNLRLAKSLPESMAYVAIPHEGRGMNEEALAMANAEWQPDMDYPLRVMYTQRYEDAKSGRYPLNVSYTETEARQRYRQLREELDGLEPYTPRQEAVMDELTDINLWLALKRHAPLEGRGMKVTPGPVTTPYNFLQNEDDDMPRLIGSGIIGAGSGALGANVDRAGLLFGILFALIGDASKGPSTPFHHVVNGVLDGSAALVTRRIIKGEGF